VHEQPLNEQVLYDVSSDSRTHGRFAIANGAVRAADVRAAARKRGTVSGLRKGNSRGCIAACQLPKQLMATHRAAVRKWPHVDYCIASGLICISSDLMDR